jgi:hypothetical protein
MLLAARGLLLAARANPAAKPPVRHLFTAKLPLASLLPAIGPPPAHRAQTALRPPPNRTESVSQTNTASGRFWRFIRCYTTRMTIVLSHISALEYWLAPQGSKPAATLASESFQLPATSVSAASLRTELPSGLALSRPLHVLTSKPVHESSETIRHHARSAPSRSRTFFRIADDVYVCSVEFAFMQVAERMDLIDLIRLGYELCGTYSMRHGTQDGFHQRPSLTTVRKLKAYAVGSPRAHGRTKALRAVQYIHQGSASPAETRLAMNLLLPYRLGGFNLPHATLNKMLELSPEERKLAQRRFLVCDVYWDKARLGLEYDSDAHHVGAAKISADAIRRNALTVGGTTVITITRAQYNNSILFAETARSIAKMLGTHVRPRCADFEAKQRILRETLHHDPEWATRSTQQPLSDA